MADYKAMVEVAAYYRAERRGFCPGYETEDWLEAEREVQSLLPGPVRPAIPKKISSRVRRPARVAKDRARAGAVLERSRRETRAGATSPA